MKFTRIQQRVNWQLNAQNKIRTIHFVDDVLNGLEDNPDFMEMDIVQRMTDERMYAQSWLLEQWMCMEMGQKVYYKPLFAKWGYLIDEELDFE